MSMSSAVFIPYWALFILTATGPGSERVRGSMENTEVFRVMADALGLAAAGP